LPVGLLDLPELRCLLGRHDALRLERLLADDAVVDLLARGRLCGLLRLLLGQRIRLGRLFRSRYDRQIARFRRRRALQLLIPIDEPAGKDRHRGERQ
jgi:hypothetical protein